MNGTLLIPNLCRPWSVPHPGRLHAPLGAALAEAGGRAGGRGASTCFLLVVVEVNGGKRREALHETRDRALGLTLFPAPSLPFSSFLDLPPVPSPCLSPAFLSFLFFYYCTFLLLSPLSARDGKEGMKTLHVHSELRCADRLCHGRANWPEAAFANHKG